MTAGFGGGLQNEPNSHAVRSFFSGASLSRTTPGGSPAAGTKPCPTYCLAGLTKRTQSGSPAGPLELFTNRTQIRLEMGFEKANPFSRSLGRAYKTNPNRGATFPPRCADDKTNPNPGRDAGLKKRTHFRDARLPDRFYKTNPIQRCPPAGADGWRFIPPRSSSPDARVHPVPRLRV